MSAFLPVRVHGADAEPDHPRLLQRPFSPAEQRARWEVRAAQWRAQDIAESVFGRIESASLLSLRAAGPLRGLLHFEVPFRDLDVHRDREQRFLAAVETDPILAQVRLVYVFVPRPSECHSAT